MSEFPRMTLSYGELGGDDGELGEEIAARFAALGPYQMQLVGEDAQSLVAAVNQGIDSRLTGIVESTFEWKKHQLCSKLHCAVTPRDMRVLLRRLAEGTEEQQDLAAGILGSVGVEWA